MKKVLHCHNHPLYAEDILSLKSYNKNNSYIVDRKREGFRVWFVHEFEVWLKLSLSLQDPYAELFLWSVLCQKVKLQEFFLSRCDSPLLMAEFAAIFYNRLSEYYRSGTGQDRLLDMKEKYVDVIMEVAEHLNTLTCVPLAKAFLKILDLAFATNKNKTHALLEAPNSRVDEMSILDFAAHGDLRRIMTSKRTHK